MLPRANRCGGCLTLTHTGMWRRRVPAFHPTSSQGDFPWLYVSRLARNFIKNGYFRQTNPLESPDRTGAVSGPIVHSSDP